MMLKQNGTVDTTKNATRLASVLGTWTAETRLKTSIGDNTLTAWFVMHIMPDPMRGYGCQLENCSEIDNNVCTIIQERRDDDHRDSYYYNIFSGNKDRLHGTAAADRRKCVKMQAQEVLDWSDISVFYNFGVAIESTLLNFHMNQNTSGWVGPYNLIAAQNETAALTLESIDPKQTNNNNTTNTTTAVVDGYTVRYVQTPSTQYLQPPIMTYDDQNNNNTLFGPGGASFDRYMGRIAINETIFRQSTVETGSRNHERVDPYYNHLKTCKNAGSVRPILPLFRFDFVKDEEKENKDKAKRKRAEERLELQMQLDYKVMIMPEKQSREYQFMPAIQALFNLADDSDDDDTIPDAASFKVSGPYCYEEDPHRAWTFDFHINDAAKQEKQTVGGRPPVLQFYRGCLEGLPCLPGAGVLAAAGNAAESISYPHDNNNHSHGGGGDGNHGKPPKPVIIHVDRILYKLGTYFLAVAFLISNIWWCRRHNRIVKRMKRVHEDEMIRAIHGDDLIVATPSRSVASSANQNQTQPQPQQPGCNSMPPSGNNLDPEIENNNEGSAQQQYSPGNFSNDTVSALSDPLAEALLPQGQNN